MEWVEVTGKTLEEAKEAALDELGVDESDAEFEVIAEAKAGLFGLMRSEARVRARVLPTSARPKVERRERRRSSSRRDRPATSAVSDEAPANGPRRNTSKSASPANQPRRSEKADPDGPFAENLAPSGSETAETDEPKGRPRRAQQSRAEPTRSEQTGSEQTKTGRTRTGPTRTPETVGRGVDSNREGEPQMEDAESRQLAIEAAEEFLSGVASRFTTRFEVAHRELPEDIVEIGVTGDDLGLLIGPKGQTLSALQELTRTVVQRKVPPSRTRIMVDVAGYREARREALERFTRQVAEQVIASGEVRELEPMSAADRKVVHDTANDIDGVSTTSEGEDPSRRVVISPAPMEGNALGA